MFSPRERPISFFFSCYADCQSLINYLSIIFLHGCTLLCRNIEPYASVTSMKDTGDALYCVFGEVCQYHAKGNVHCSCTNVPKVSLSANFVATPGKWSNVATIYLSCIYKQIQSLYSSSYKISQISCIAANIGFFFNVTSSGGAFSAIAYCS